MRPSKLWKTYQALRLEKTLMTVPREDRRLLRTYVFGKRVE